VIGKLLKKSIKLTHGFPVRSLYAGRGSILALHRVLPMEKRSILRNTGLEITPEKLEELLSFFKHSGHEFISLNELPDFLRSNTKSRFVIFTFDDGYSDNLDYAYPVLKDQNVPFTIYVATGYIDGTDAMWWYLIEKLLMDNEELDFQYKEKNYHFLCNSIDKKNSVFKELRNLFTNADGEGRDKLYNELFVRNGIDLYEYTKQNSLTYKQIEALSADELVTIGAHTHSHLALNQLSREEIIEDINKNISKLINVVNGDIEHFTYPFGSKNEAGWQEFEVIKEMGFKTATTGRVANVFGQHLKYNYAIPRLYVNQDTDRNYLKRFISGEEPCIRGLRKRVITF